MTGGDSSHLSWRECSTKTSCELFVTGRRESDSKYPEKAATHGVNALSLLRRMIIRNMMLQRQLELLAECGIRPKDGIGLSDLLARHRETEYERSPFTLLLRVLGSAQDEDSEHGWSDNIWKLNIETVHGPGDYVRVAHHMAMLAGGVLPITDLRDGIDPRSRVAWL